MKTNNINLTKKAVGNSHLRISDCGTHVTNGRWAIRRELLKQAPLLTTVESAQALFPRAEVESIPASTINQVVPYHTIPVTYTRTCWVQTSDYQGAVYKDAVLFVARGDNGDSQMWIDRRYVDLFKLEEFVGQAAPGLVSRDAGIVGEREDWQLLIMSDVHEYQEGLR